MFSFIACYLFCCYSFFIQRKLCLFKFVAIVFCFTLYVLPITQTSKGPKKIIRVNENLSCRLFELSGFFWGEGGEGLVNDDVTLEGGSPNDYA